MNTTHLFPRPFYPPEIQGEVREYTWRTLTQVAWSNKPTGKLAIFVHGFNSAALTAWANFYTHWPQSLGGWDLVFYGYPAFDFSFEGLIKKPKLNMVEHANDFVQFIHQMDTPSHLYQESLRPLGALVPSRTTAFTYSRIALIAHSMGALVCRRAILQNKNSGWVKKSNLILFAPAHKGARPLLLLHDLTNVNWGSKMANWIQQLGVTVAPLGETIDPLIKWRVPEFRALEPPTDDGGKAGEFIRTLEKQTEAHVSSRGAVPPFVVDQLVWARPDEYVINDWFAKDEDRVEMAVTVDGKNHSEICKPTHFPQYEKPLNAVSDVLSKL